MASLTDSNVSTFASVPLVLVFFFALGEYRFVHDVMEFLLGYTRAQIQAVPMMVSIESEMMLVLDSSVYFYNYRFKRFVNEVLFVRQSACMRQVRLKESEEDSLWRASFNSVMCDIEVFVAFKQHSLIFEHVLCDLRWNATYLRNFVVGDDVYDFVIDAFDNVDLELPARQSVFEAFPLLFVESVETPAPVVRSFHDEIDHAEVMNEAVRIRRLYLAERQDMPPLEVAFEEDEDANFDGDIRPIDEVVARQRYRGVDLQFFEVLHELRVAFGVKRFLDRERVRRVEAFQSVLQDILAVGRSQFEFCAWRDHYYRLYREAAYDCARIALEPWNLRRKGVLIIRNQMFSGFGVAALVFEREIYELGAHIPGALKLLALFVSLRETHSWIGVGSAIMQFALSFFEGEMFSDLIAFVKNELSFLNDLIHSQASSFVESANMIWDLLHDEAFALTPLYQSFWGVFSSLSVGIPLVTLGICPDYASWKSLAERLSPGLNCSPNEFGVRVVKLMQAAVNSAWGILRTRDPSVLFGGARHEAWLKLSNDICNDTVGVAGGKISFFSTDERIALLEGQIETGEKLVKRMEHFKCSPSVITVVHIQLSRLRQALGEAQAFKKNNRGRVVPFSLMFKGEVGIGKTVLTNNVHSTIMNAIGYSPDPNDIYNIKAHQKHFDNLTSGVPTFLFDDVDKNPANPTPDSQLFVGHVIQVINNNSVLAPMASLDNKGRVYMRPLLVMMTTNLEGCNLKGKTTDAPSFWRRWNYRIIMELKPKYMKDPSQNRTLDPTKINGDTDLWNFTVQSFRSLEDPNTFDVAHMGTDFLCSDTGSLLKFLSEEFLVHYQRENKRLEESAVIEFCPDCKGMMKYHKIVGHQDSVPVRGPCPVNTRDTVVPQALNWTENWLDFLRVPESEETAVPVVLEQPFSESFPMNLYRFCVGIAMGLLGFSFLARAITMYCVGFVQYRIFRPMQYRYSRGVFLGMARVFVHEPRDFIRLFRIAFFGASYELGDASNNRRIDRVVSAIRNQSTVILNFTVFTGLVIAALTAIGYKSLADRKKAEDLPEELASAQVSPGIVPQAVVNEVDNPLLVNVGVQSKYSVPRQGLFARNLTLSTGTLPLSTESISFGDLTDLVAKNTAMIRIGSKSLRALRYDGNYFITAYHPFDVSGREHFTVKLEMGDFNRPHTNTSVIVRKNFEYMRIPGKDLAVVWISPVVPVGASLKKFVAPVSQISVHSQLDACVFVHREGDQVEKFVTPISTRTIGGLAKDGTTVPTRLTYQYPYATVPTADGWCGEALVGKRGRSAWIISSHVCSCADKDAKPPVGMGHGDELCSAEIDAVIDAIRAVCPMGVPVAPFDLQQGTDMHLQCAELNEKSMLNGITTLNTELGGSIISVDGKKMFRPAQRSMVKPTCFAEDFEDLRREAMGDEHFVAPVSNGISVNGVWKHPYLNAIRQLETSKNADPGELDACYGDYLHGAEDLPGVETFRVLTEEEAIFGVPGSSISGFDMNTSMGYPFFKKKVHFVDKTKMACGDRSFMSDVVWRMFDKAHDTIKSGFAYIPVTSWTMKDEALKESKNAVRGQRIFSCLPFYFNILLKMYFGPIIAFMGMHKQFFECFAGMNMASSEATFFVNWMTFFGRLTCIDGDMKWCDKGIDNVTLVWVGNVLLSLGKLLRYTPDQLRACAALYMGLVYQCVFVKGDLFFLSHSNPSGSLLTVVVNSIYLSGEYRVAWFRGLKAEYKLFRQFRNYCHLATLGDDNIANVSPMAGWFTFRWLSEVFMSDGKYLVPADKTDDALYGYKDIFSCSFLKRRFEWNPDLGHYAAVLEKASLAKMLTSMLVSGKVGKKDQEVGILTSASLEMFLRGRDAYDQFTSTALAACRRHDLRETWYKPYDFHIANFASDHFQTWFVQDAIVLQGEFAEI